MSVPASKVKSLCTDSEVALVRASRTPQLDKHNAAELKPLAARARKLFDKWQGLSRKQTRTRNRQVGSANQDTSTQLKSLIFREALDAFEARLAKLNANAPATVRTSKPKTKKVRAAGHRQARAAVRTGMTAALDLTNAKRAGSKKPSKAAVANAAVAKATAAKEVEPTKAVKMAAKLAANKAAAKKAAKPTRSTGPSQTLAAKKTPAKPLSISAAQQLRAATVAKQARVARSGQTTRVLGHVSARGRRAQARRDSKN